MSRRQSAGAVVGWMFCLVTRWCSDSAGVFSLCSSLSAHELAKGLKLHAFVSGQRPMPVDGRADPGVRAELARPTVGPTVKLTV
jgi:hypothetical protein